MTTPADGWYPDPDDAARERWFTRGDWTEQTRKARALERPTPVGDPVDTAGRPAPKLFADFATIALIAVGIVMAVLSGLIGVLIAALGVLIALLAKAHNLVLAIGIVGALVALLVAF